MRRTFLPAFALAALILAACSDGGGGDARPGDPKVYERIESMTDCAELQAQFDTAMANVERYPAGDDRREAPLAYSEAADARLEEVGCYDE